MNDISHAFPNPQYLGCKYRHLDWIGHYIPGGVSKVADGFAGSQSVSYFMKGKGYEVYANDFMNYSNQIGKALIENSSDRLSDDDVQMLFSGNSNPEYYNLIETEFSDLFFSREDARLIDAFRSNVDRLNSEYKKALAFSIINRTLTRKITMGHFAHTKALSYANDADRIKRNASLARPIKDMFNEFLTEYNAAVFDNGRENNSFCGDVMNFIEALPPVDMIYLDPPYVNSHPDYQGYYHLLETLVNYWKDKKFINSIHRYEPKIHSGFDTKKDIMASFGRLFLLSKKIPYWLISYNDRSYPDKKTILDMIEPYKRVEVIEKPYMNSVGGKGSVKGCNELLFICRPY